jgi:uncharacterized membrane protein YfcA
MSPLGLALSVLIGVSLGFFGGGGSILTVPLLVYVFDLGPKQAIASSLLVVGAASIAGAAQHWRAGNVELRTGLVFGAAGMAGAHLGGRAGAYLDGALLLLLFAAMMVLTSLAMWRGRRAPSGPPAERRALGPLVAQGLGVGLFTGLIGAGGGFLIVPALALWAGLPMSAAVGTSLFVIVLNTLAGFSGYASHVRVDFALVAAVATAAIAGSFLGSWLARRTDPNSLRRAFALFVVAMAAVIFVRETDVWLTAARAALPASVPELVFALLVLAVGIATGRISRRVGADPMADRSFSEGAGI